MRKNLLRSLFIDPPNGEEDRTKFIHKRIQIVQKYIPALNSAISDYINRTSGTSNCSEKIAAILQEYAKSETVTTGIKEQISSFACILNELCSRRINLISSMETHVKQELSEYSKMCKNLNSDLKASISAYERERIRLRHLKRVRSDRLEDRQQIALAEDDYFKARSESSRAAKNLEEQTDIFERRKLNGLRDVLLAWTVAELRFHAKALELFTDAYNAAANINVEADVEEFRKRLRSENSPRLDSSRETTYQRSESLMHLLSMSFNRSGERLTGVGIPHPSPSAVSAGSDANNSCVF